MILKYVKQIRIGKEIVDTIINPNIVVALVSSITVILVFSFPSSDISQ
ncbi:hypothetical protein Emtol_0212 (plasmid) [Emticicia oligotrophica DSM 17448]|uniref:Uncharacterized protein n=1 Tax=Emticicia oligotrophica (strain DSM 17448 / CIP 109782 / MTCC 6937 / GPTSA100-15) TaxID=929562 RepID=A0ABM5N7U0_EMTOG|nr:hypothetical protein Emtol_0212 [Emticicia oligotrophica DSM 17448]